MSTTSWRPSGRSSRVTGDEWQKVTVDPGNRELIGHRVVRSIATNSAGRFIGLVSWLVLTPFMLQQLGAADYGLLVVIQSVLGFSSLLDLGIGGAVTRFVAQHVARGEFDAARRVVATALRLYLLVGLGIIVVSVIAAPIVAGIFATDEGQARHTQLLVVFVGLSAGVAIPFSIARSTLYGLQRYDIANLVDTGGTLLTAAATVVVLLLGFGVPGLMALNVPVYVLAFIVSGWFIHRVAPDLRFGWSGAEGSLVGRVLGFSWPLVTMRLASQFQTRTDEIVIASFLPISFVTPYALARKLSELARVVAIQFVKVLMPLASELDARGDRAGLQSLYLTATRVVLMIFIPFAAVLMVLARPILVAWVGSVYGDAAILVVILTLAGLMDISQWPGEQVLQGIARHHPLALMALANGIANVALSIVLVQRYGVIGVAFGTLVPMILETVILVIPYTWRVIGISPSRAVNHALLPVLVPAIPAVAIPYILREAAGITSTAGTIALALVGVTMYLTTYLRFGASRAERSIYRGTVLGTMRFAEEKLRRPWASRLM
jgi:O-antigen/teichoic acid export membrane protein